MQFRSSRPSASGRTERYVPCGAPNVALTLPLGLERNEIALLTRPARTRPLPSRRSPAPRSPLVAAVGGRQVVGRPRRSEPGRRGAQRARRHPKREGRPGGGPHAWSSRLAALPARPSSQTGHRGADRSDPLTPGERRAADLGTLADRSRSARALVTIETSAVRVLGRGGGGPGQRGCLGRVCLTQRGELERRIHGAPHQLAKRAFGLSTDDRRGEHVFVKLRRRSDGRGDLQGFLQAPAAIPGRERPTGKWCL